MKKLSKQLESRLMTAIEAAAGHVSGGDDPNTAIVKAAQAHSIPAGSVHLMVHAYNTGKTTRQRRDGETLWDKAADFDLADPERIAKLLYPEQVKTSAALAQETAVADVYSFSPTGLLQRRQSREKAAAAFDWRAGFVAEAPPPLPRDEKAAIRKASAAVDRARHAAEEMRRQAAAAFDKAAATFSELSDYFRAPGCQPIPVVRENVLLLHGTCGERVMDELISVTPGLAKMAMHQTPVPRSLPPASGQPYVLVERLFAELSTYNRLRDEHEKMAAESQRQAEVLLGPFGPPVPSPSVLSGLSLTKAGGAAGFGAGMLAEKGMNAVGSTLGMVANQIKAPDPATAIGNNLADLTDPDHEAELRKIRVQAMLQDLLLNDPVVSGYEPDEATSAYNEIVEAAPHLADQRLAVQSLMRKRLTQGALDPFDVDQLLGMESQMQKNRQQIGRPGAPASAA